MCKCKCRKCLVLICEPCKLCHNIHKLLSHKLKCLCHNNKVSNVAACSSKVDDSLSLRALDTIRIHMRHDIMSYKLLPLLCNLVVDVILMGLKLLYLLIGDIKTKLLLCLCKCNPELSPCTELLVRRKNILHLLARVSLSERGLITVCAHSCILLSDLIIILQLSIISA